MLEEKYNKKGNLVICKYSTDGFSKGSVYEIREDGTDRVRVVKDDDGDANSWWRQNFDLYELIEEVPQKFTVGSKWVTKCDIYANDGMARVKSLGMGHILKVVNYTKGFGVVEFNNDVWLNEEEALLLLEPYTEPLKEMTAEQIAKEFGVKVVE